MRRKILFNFILLLLSGNCAVADEYKITVNGMVCGFCAQGIEKLLLKNSAVDRVEVILADRIVQLYTKEGQTISEDEIRELIEKSGYAVEALEKLR